MDERRFDELSRVFARIGTRRGLLRGALTAAAGAFGLRTAAGLTAPSGTACGELGARCRRRRGQPCCSGYCSERRRCACPPGDPTCNQPPATGTAEATEFVAAADPLCPAGCPTASRCLVLVGGCCPEDRVYVECQSADTCETAGSLRCCVGPEVGPERCCPLALICGDICCRDDEICEEGTCTGGVQYAGGVWLRRP